MISELRSAPNLLTLLRLMLIPFIVIAVVDGSWEWAFGVFIFAGLTDGLDGLLARALRQRTQIGEYLDPIADKLLLSTMFLVLSAVHAIPWKATVLVFSRDIIILVICALLYGTGAMRDFRPSIFGKLNTFAQIFTVTFVLMREVWHLPWIALATAIGLWATMLFTVVSGLHYTVRVARRLHHPSPSPPASR